ncbi:MAG: response regulator [Limisphaerales bacterium]
MLLDLDMPDQNGWQTFDVMCHVAPRVPVLIITAVPHQAKRAAQLGAAGLMEKPLDLPRLLQILSDLLAESAETRRAWTTGKAAEFDTLPARPKAEPSYMGGTC